MANAIYPLYKAALLDGASNIDIKDGTVKVMLIDSADYTYSAAHDMLDDVAAGSRVATATLANKTVTAGVFDADDATFTSVTGDPCEALIFYIDTGVESTSRLVYFCDTGVTGLPVTPNGGNISLAFNASGIFAL